MSRMMNCISIRPIPVRCNCWPRVRAKRCSVKAITFWLLSANLPINRGTLEKESRTVAQRLSVLHGINAPEFFDKAVFSSLEVTLSRDDVGISDTGDAEPGETMKVYQMLAELITSDVRLTIESATQSECCRSR